MRRESIVAAGLPKECEFWPLAGGELGRLIADRDWSTSPLGPIARWSAALVTTVSVMLTARAQIVMFWGPDYAALYNDAYAPSIGDKHPTALGRPARENWAELWDDLEPLLRGVRETGETFFAKDRPFYIERHGFGETVYFDISYSAVREPDGSIGGVLCIVAETTERVQAQQLAVAEREKLTQMFEQAPSFMAHLDGPTHVFALTNRAYLNLVGHRDVIGKPLREALPEIEGQGFHELLDEVYRSGEAHVGLAHAGLFAAHAGRVAEQRLVDFVFQPVKVADGSVTGIFVEGSDVTERQRALEVQQFAQAHQALLLELGDRLRNIDDPLGILATAAEMTGRFLGAGRAGYAEVDASGDCIACVRDWTDGALGSVVGSWPIHNFGERLVRAFRSGNATSIADIAAAETAGVAQAYRRMGMVSGIAVPIMRGGRFSATMFAHSATARDWSQAEENLLRDIGNRVWDALGRARAAEALRASALQFRTFAEVNPNHVWTATPDGGLDWVNERTCEYFGLPSDDLLGDKWAAMVHPDDIVEAGGQWAAALGSGEPYQTEFRLLRRDGLYRWHIARAVALRDDTGSIVRWVGANTDIEDQKLVAEGLEHLNATLELRVAERTQELIRTQDALRQSQKMESIGSLAGGIAHDFNNLLQVIGGNLQLAAKHLGNPGQAAIRIDNAISGVERGARLASQLLAFSRRQPLAPRVINLGRLIRDLDHILRRSLGEEVEIETIVGGGLWNTQADPANVENALLNLAINARDAMQGRGKLTIEAGNASLDDVYARAHQDVSAGQYVMLAVTDTGGGIAPGILDKIFDPFFTTKPVGKGSGLGLSMVYGFARQSGGHVKVYSEPGAGTTFRLYLPRSTMPEDAHVEPDASPVVGGTETILIAEDDDAVRDTTYSTLVDLGYTVLRARDAASALAILEGGARVDLLFTDVVMPGPLKSTELARRARELLPGIAVLFTSGYTENSIVHGGRLDPGVQLISKPFATEALARRLRVLLAQRSANAPQPGPESANGAAKPRLQGLRVLLCEDDVLIRMNTADMLQDMGIEVVEAATAAQAIAASHSAGFDLLVTDVTLPDGSGVVLAREIRQAAPGLPVVFASGHSRLPEAADMGGCALLSKPYSEAQLQQCLEQVLASARGARDAGTAAASDRAIS